MEDEEGEARGGTSRRRIARRASIFIGPAAIAQASAALPSGPTEPGFYWASLAVFVLCALSMLLPWPRFPRWTVLVPTLGYLVSVTLLLISGGTDPTVQSTAGGLSALVLLPVLGMALYYPGWYTAVAVGASMVSLAVVGVAVSVGDPVRKGQKLLSIEAMKMETTIYAERPGRVVELLAQVGHQVKTGELLLRLGGE